MTTNMTPDALPASGPRPAGNRTDPVPATVRGALRTGRLELGARVGVWAVVTAAGLALPYLVALYPLQVATQGVTQGILALSIGWLLRQTGLLSFGHAAFYGVTGYVVGNLAVHTGLAPLPALLLGIVGGTVLALVFALIIARSSGIAFAMLSLALGMMLWVASYRSRALTDGLDGMVVRLQGTFLGRDVADYAGPVHAWPAAWLVLMAVVGGLWAVSRSVFGRRLVAIRENEERVRFSGVSTFLPRVAAITLSGLCASLAGAVAVLQKSFVSPDDLFFSASGLALIVAVIGGIGSVWGPPIGAVAFAALQAWLAQSGHYQAVLGLVLMAFVVVAPGGGAQLVTRVRAAVVRRRERQNHA
jgi:branched-chain amino acid transport system permease protein